MFVDGLLSSYNPDATQPLSGIRRSFEQYILFLVHLYIFMVIIGVLLKSFCSCSDCSLGLVLVHIFLFVYLLCVCVCVCVFASFETVMNLSLCVKHILHSRLKSLLKCWKVCWKAFSPLFYSDAHSFTKTMFLIIFCFIRLIIINYQCIFAVPQWYGLKRNWNEM